MLRLVTANVNGIRATARRGGLVWLEAAQADVICLQEVRASAEQLRRLLPAPVSRTGTRASPRAPRRAGPGSPSCPGSGPAESARGSGMRSSRRPVGGSRSTCRRRSGPLTVVSAYVHTGQAGTPRQAEKERFLDAMTVRMGGLRALADAGGHAVISGDLNVAHHEVDICNWKGNRGRAGFLESERAYFDRWFDGAHWVDVHRATAGEGPGPYTWWTWRGQAFDRDVGWRIDYQLATAALAARCGQGRGGSSPDVRTAVERPCAAGRRLRHLSRWVRPRAAHGRSRPTAWRPGPSGRS